MSKPHIPINLTKLPFIEKVKRLVVGDAFTFFLKEPLTAEHPTDENTLITLVPGDYFTRRFEDGGPGRVFRITAYHEIESDQLFVYETIFTGIHHNAAE